MSAKYFAEYCYSEGDIKPGDKFIDIWAVDDSIRECKSFDNVKGFRDPVIMDTRNLISQPQNCRRLKLFLCTKDVQIGDKVLVYPDAVKLEIKGVTFIVEDIIDHIYPDVPDVVYKIPVIKYVTHPYLPEVVGTTRQWVIENLYKVVGELSPEATWVKEGDKFDDYDYRYKSKNGWDIVKDITIILEPYRHLYKIGLQGPCGHFH